MRLSRSLSFQRAWLAASFALVFTAPVQGLDVRLTTSAEWADNVSRTSSVPHQKSAAIYSALVSVGETRQWPGNWSASLDGEAGIETVPSYDALDHFNLGPRAGLRRKFGLGPLAPLLEFNTALLYHGFRESGRNGVQLEAELKFSKRLTESWRISATGAWDKFNARRRPFDLTSRRLALETTWDATDRWQLGGGIGRIWGQQTANAAGAIYYQALAGDFGPAVATYYRAIPWEVTNTFGPGWVAYRVDGRVDQWWLTLTPALGDNTSLPLRYESVKLVNRVGVRYDASFLSLSLVHRF